MLGFFIVFLVFNVSFAEEPDSQEYPTLNLMAQADDKLLKLIKEHKAEIARQTASPPHKGQPQKPIAPTNPFTYKPTNSFNYNIVKEIDPKAEKMKKCFVDIQEVLDNRQKKELLSQGVPSKHVGCVGMGYPVGSGIWSTAYPTAGNCYDTRKGFSYGFAGWVSPPPLSEAEKDAKLNQCNQHLTKLKAGENPVPPPVAKAPISMNSKNYSRDPKAKKMAKCFSDTYEAIKVDEKASLIAKGSKLMNISCADRTHYSSYGRNIWCSSAPTRAFCYDITGRPSPSRGAGMCGFSEGYVVPEARKDRQLADCNQRLERRSALNQCLNSIKQRGSSVEPLYAYSMLSQSNEKQIRELKKCKSRLSQLRLQDEYDRGDRGGR